jgi:hypothetical protein
MREELNIGTPQATCGSMVRWLSVLVLAVVTTYEHGLIKRWERSDAQVCKFMQRQFGTAHGGNQIWLTPRSHI